MGRADRDIDAWMARLADGDRTAFDPLYVVLWPMVRAFCARRLGDESLADDTAQEALLRVFERASAYDPSRPAIPWILAFATWECRTTRGKRLRTREENLASEPRNPTDLATDVLRADLAAVVRDVIGAMGAADEAVLWAWMERDLDDGPAGPSLRKRMERARRRFANLWRTHGGT